MIRNQNREKMNPGMASKKGRHPTQDTLEDSKWNWRKTFYIKGVRMGTRMKKAFRKTFSRKTIRTNNDE